jgi:hypothetical protein
MASVASLAPFAALLAGCFIVTGSTDGYERSAQSVSEAGTDAPAEGGTSGLSLGCVSALDCASDGGTPSLCCLSLTSLSSAATACQPSPCGGSFSVQLCKASSECAADAGGCLSQTCTAGSATVTIQACGNVLGCTPL